MATVVARRRKLGVRTAEELVAVCLVANVVVLDEAVYAALEDEARARSRRDAHDWPVVACGLALSGGVWTNDNDFLGTGVPTWTTASLQVWLDRHADG